VATGSLSDRSFWVGDWLVLPRLGKIRRGDEAIHVSPRAMAVLVYLAEADGNVVSRNDILDAVWPRMAVTQDALSQCIVELRRAFRDNSKCPSVIETIPKSGIRLIVSISPVDAATTADQPTAGVALSALPEQSGCSDRPDVDPASSRERLFAGLLRAKRFYLPAALSIVLVAAGVFLYLKPGGLPNSVAVLPFENLSPDPEDAFIAAGLHGEILNQLTKISALNVIGQHSMLKYVDTESSIREIASELNVQTVLETSVRYADGHVRITSILIDAATGRNLWSETYDEEFKDIFAIESDVAREIADALTAEFSLAEQEAIEKGLTDSPAAHRAYLRAENVGFAAMTLAQEYLDEAIDHDPDFAMAHARKAQMYAGALIAQLGEEAADPSEWSALERLARESAEHALAVDGDTWLAYVALGELHQHFWRWSEAREAFEKAARTTPRGVPRSVYGSSAFMDQYNFKDAIRSQREVVALNPLEAEEHWILGLFHAYSGNSEAAADAFRAAVDLSPDNPVHHLWLAHAEGMRRNTERALEALHRAEKLPVAHDSSITIANLAYAYSQNGAAEDARRLVELLAERVPDRHHQAGNWVLAYLAIGDRAQARESLETVIAKITDQVPDAGFLTLRLIRANIYSDPVLDEPAFQALREQLRGR